MHPGHICFKLKKMKSNFKLVNLIVITVFLNILFISCKKKSDPAPEESGAAENVPMGRLSLHLHNYIENTEVDAYNITYTTSDGRKISLDLGQLYLSNIQLIKLDGSVYTIPNAIVLKKQEFETYQVADVPVGNYKTVRFNIGFDQATNQKLPSGTVDLFNTPNMWFSSTAQPNGYVFFNFQGKIDTTSNANGTAGQMQPFKYMIGTNSNLRQKTMPDKNFTISPNQNQFLHLQIDYSKIFNGIQLNNPGNLSVASTDDNASVLANKIANNIPSLFIYEE